MKRLAQLLNCYVAGSVMFGLIAVTTGETVERAAIAAHQDQIQNLVMTCEETRAFDVDPAVIAQEPLNFRQPKIDLKRTEMSTLRFTFLNGNVCYDRATDAQTLGYWTSKGLPAIVRQIQTVSATGKIEELTTQRLANGKPRSFGGLRQMSEFAPDITIDIAMGLRLLGGRQWLSKDDLSNMQEIQQPNPNLVILRALDGAGHVHELHFDRSLLYALVYYRCTNPHGAYLEITNSDFWRHGTIYFPGKIVRSSSIADSTGQIRHPLVFTLKVKDAVVNDAENTPDRYAIAWPAHLQLFDARTNDRVDIGATTRPFSDDDIRQQLAEKHARQLTLEKLATDRINHILNQQPSTRP
jgi:hypothetical protein